MICKSLNILNKAVLTKNNQIKYNLSRPFDNTAFDDYQQVRARPFGVEYSARSYRCACGRLAYGHQVRVSKDGVKPICVDCRLNGNYTPKPITPEYKPVVTESIEQIVERLWSAGEPAPSIGRQIGRGKEYVYYLAKKLNLTRSNTKAESQKIEAELTAIIKKYVKEHGLCFNSLFGVRKAITPQFRLVVRHVFSSHEKANKLKVSQILGCSSKKITAALENNSELREAA